MIGKATPYMITNLNGYGIYFVFGAATTLGAVYEFFFMPETMGKSLEEIDILFGGSPIDRRESQADVDDKYAVEHRELNKDVV